MVRWLQPFAISVLLVISFSFTEEVSLEARCWPLLFKKDHQYHADQYYRRRQEYIFLNCRKIYLIDPIFTKTMFNIKSKIKIEGASKTFFGHNLNMVKRGSQTLYQRNAHLCSLDSALSVTSTSSCLSGG
jgi:hypothetical protein